MRWYKQLWRIRLTLVLLLAPICFLPIPLLYPSTAGRCAYGVLLMATFWTTEALPLAVTALLPVVIFPWLGVMDTTDVSKNYLKSMLFFGGLMVALAIERWNLHKRIALRVLLLVGSKPAALVMGFMSTTAFLSMWISNTATAAMMMPIAHAVLSELRRQGRISNCPAAAESDEQGLPSTTDQHPGGPAAVISGGTERAGAGKTYEVGDGENTKSKEGKNSASEAGQLKQTDVTLKSPWRFVGGPKSTATVHPIHLDPESGTPQRRMDAEEHDDEWFDNFGKALRLCVAYSANIGGSGSLIGTGPNIVFHGHIDTLYGPKSGINFSSWIVFAGLNMVISLFLAWIWLISYFVGPREILKLIKGKNQREKKEDPAMVVIRNEYAKLGRMSFAEVMVLLHFIVLALMWLTRNPQFAPGWQSLLPTTFVSDACVAISIVMMLFIVPSRKPNYLCFRKSTDTSEPGTAPALLDWPTVQRKMPWNIVMLLGGGYALADACKVSGLSSEIGKFFVNFRHFPAWLLALLLSALTAAVTEVTSNVATATIFLPIVAQLANGIRVNPLYLMMPVTVAASFAFMLPVATPPNAIVFAYGQMKILDMMKAGLLMNIVCLLVLQLAINTWAHAYFNLGEFPSWADEHQ